MARKFESEFDAEELAKITHRGLQSLSRGQVEPRVTQEQKKTLRSTQELETKPEVAVKRFFNMLLDSCTTSVKSMFTPKQKHVRQCDLYGHVLKAGWKGDFPVCHDCGVIINDLKMVRGATPKDERGNCNGPGFVQQDRKFVK